MTEPMPITDAAEVLNRQVPAGMHDDVYGPSPEAFKPNRGMDGFMSTLRGRVDPEEAYRRHTANPERQSLGTWGVQVGLAMSQNLTCIDDGLCDAETPLDHASVDFNALTRKQKNTVSGILRDAAVDAGPLYTP